MIKETRTIHYTLTKNDTRQFIKIPFEVKKDTEKISIKYEYPGDNASSIPNKKKNVIDIALLDEQGKEVGATGSAHREITISASYSTPGYDLREIKDGNWTIICGAYLIQEDELTVTYHIETYKKHFRWLRGDLHLHTVHSDGASTVEELAARAKRADFDFLIITDHNNFFHMKRLPYVPELTIIPGVELSPYIGHANIWGLEVPYSKSYCVNNASEFKELIDESSQKGAVISLNHPFCNLCPWRMGMEDIDYDAIEVWNGPMRPDNLETYRYWHRRLLQGSKLVAVGGSDFHKNIGPINIFGRPTTYVYAYSNSKTDILDAIKRGRVAVTQSSKTEIIEMTSENSPAGDTLRYTENSNVNIKIKKLRKSHTLNVYNNDKIIYSHKSSKSKPFDMDVPVREKGFVRAEIIHRPSLFEKLATMAILFVAKREDTFKKLPDYLYSFTNPIFFE